jgi:hypothetical protein
MSSTPSALVVRMLYLAVVLLGTPYCIYFVSLVGVRDLLVSSVLGAVLALVLSLILYNRLKPWLRSEPP